MRAVLLLAFCGFGLQAEFLRVALTVEQMDCASCVKSLEMGLRKTRGVDKVSVTAEEGAVFELEPGNRLTLERLRDSIKGVGFTPTRARVTVKGRPVTSDGKWRFAVEGLGKEYNLSARKGETLRQLQAADGTVITIEADSAAPPDSRTPPAFEALRIVPAQ